MTNVLVGMRAPPIPQRASASPTATRGIPGRGWRWGAADGEGRHNHDLGDADQLSRLGGAALELGDHNAAIAFFARAVIAQPDESAHYANLAGVFAMTGRVQEAARCCRDGLSKAAGPDARNNFGVVYMRLGQLDLAEAQFRAAIASGQPKPEFYSNLGEILRTLRMPR